MSHDASCGCCAGVAKKTPQDELNPPGQPALRYRAGTHGQFLQSQLTRLNESANLQQLTTRDVDDPALALANAWAAVLDVLTFYQERIVNEGYLRTATERQSVLELARAIGYELRPGVAAATFLSFTLETAPGAPAEARIDAGTKVQSVPGQDEQAQVFETLETLQARATWNALEVVHEQSVAPALGADTIYLKGQNTRLQPGDALVILGDERGSNPGSERWDFRHVSSVLVVAPALPSADPLAGYTVVRLDEALGSVAPRIEPARANPRCFALRARAALFGQAAADWKTMPASLRAGYLGFDNNESASLALHPEWPGFTLAELSDPPSVLATGTGLYGEYFQGRTFDAPKRTRTDERIDFDFVAAPPPAPVGPHNFCVRWTGWVQIPSSGSYTFHVRADDGVRLWINNNLLIDQWKNQAATNFSGVVSNLQAHQKLDIKLEYYEDGGATVMQLSWSGPGLAKQVIPRERLYPRDVHSVHLDGSYPKWRKGSWVVLSTPDYSELYEVLDARDDGRTAFALSGKSTRLSLRGENLRERFGTRLRSTSAFGESVQLPWATRPLSGLINGSNVLLDHLEPDLAAGRWLALSGHTLADIAENSAARARLTKGDSLAAVELARSGSSATLSFADGERIEVLLAAVSEVVRLASNSADQNRSRLVFEAPLVHDYLPLTFRVHANVATASHGDSKQMQVSPELLGNGDGSRAFQRFVLQQGPLTHISAATPSGILSTLDVRVDGVSWREARTLSELGAKDKAFLPRRADDAKVTVFFGDGTRGARLPTGQLNVTAKYRVGIGEAGNMGRGKLTLLLNRPLGVKDVINPVPANGGTNPEARQQAKQNAPLTVLALERIVSLLDFENFAAAFAGVGKAQAVWLWNGQQRLVHLTVTGIDGADIPRNSALYTNLAKAIDGARPRFQEFRLAQGVVLRFGVNVALKLDPTHTATTVRGAVRQGLERAFGFAARGYGQSLSGGEVLAVIQRVPGVLQVDLEQLHSHDSATIETARGPNGRLRARSARFQASEILPAQLLLFDAQASTFTEVTP